MYLLVNLHYQSYGILWKKEIKFQIELIYSKILVVSLSWFQWIE